VIVDALVTAGGVVVAGDVGVTRGLALGGSVLVTGGGGVAGGVTVTRGLELAGGGVVAAGVEGGSHVGESSRALWQSLTAWRSRAVR
jgi:hypothetical protein